MRGFIFVGATLAFACAGWTLVHSQQTAPSELPGCEYNAVPPVLSNGQTAVLQCNLNGYLQLH